MLTTQDGVNKAVTDGTLSCSWTRTADATFQMSCCADGHRSAIGITPADAAEVRRLGHLHGRHGQSGGTFNGQINAASSPSRARAGHDATTPYTMSLQLPLVSGAASGQSEDHRRAPAVHQTPAADITKGQLNGAIKNSDVQSKIIPNVATLLTKMKVARRCRPARPTCRSSALFDNGGKADPACTGACKNPDGTCAVKATTRSTSAKSRPTRIIKNVLAPDVQIFDASGNYKPTKKGDAGMHQGFALARPGFTAVKAHLLASPFLDEGPGEIPAPFLLPAAVISPLA